MKRILATILILTVCFGFFSGCHPQKKSKQTFFFEWTDAYGRQVSLEKEPMRIVSLSPAITEIIYLIGAQDKLVAVSDFCDYPEETENLPKVGGMQNINMEALVELHPDVVLIGSIVSKKDVSAIEKMNVPVITVKEENSIEGMADMIEVMGKITRHEQAAGQEAQQWRDRISLMKKQTAQRVGKRPSVYYVVGFGDAGDFTAPKSSHIHEIIQLAGCENVGASLTGWNVSREFLFQSNPDIILIRQEDYKAFCSQHPYTMLDAVKNGHVYPIESGWIDVVSPRNIQAVEFLQKCALEM